jgi:hypothetical protein
MKINLIPIIEPFHIFTLQARIILATWAKLIWGASVFCFLFVRISPLIYSSVLFTLALPVVLLTMWGCSLDQELRWSEQDEEPL